MVVVMVDQMVACLAVHWVASWVVAMVDSKVVELVVWMVALKDA